MILCYKARVVFSYMQYCFSVRAVFLSENFTSERCFSTTLAGYPLHFRRDLKFVMFSSNVVFEEFVLRSLNASPFVTPVEGVGL